MAAFRRRLSVLINSIAFLIFIFGAFDPRLDLGAKIMLGLVLGPPAWGLTKLLVPSDKPKVQQTAQPSQASRSTPEPASYPIRNPASPRGAFREYRIEYSDRHSEITDRDIYVLALDEDDPDLIKAWCYAVNDTRSFRSSRILKAMHLPTGAKVDNVARHHARTS